MTRVPARWLLSLLPIWLLLAVPALALDHEFPQPQGHVNDYAQVIPSEQAQQLELFLRDLNRQSGVEIAVVTIDSLKGGDIDDSAVRLFESWGIGKRGQDEGLLIFAVIEDRVARIEVGYGLESIIPDAAAGRVLREVIFPYFREGNYGTGLSAGVAALTERIEAAKGLQIESAAPVEVRYESDRTSPLAWVFRLILLIAAVVLFIKNPFLFLLLFGMGGGRGRISGGFGGGGFGGFGGGLSGGGGASGRW